MPGIKPAYENGPPCSSRGVDALVRMGMAGCAWGMFMGPYEAKQNGHAGLTKFMFVAKAIGKNSFKWGLFGGMYMSLNCGFEVWRRKRDWKNSMYAGALAGAATGSARVGTGKVILHSVVRNAAAAAAICSVLDVLSFRYALNVTK